MLGSGNKLNVAETAEISLSLPTKCDSSLIMFRYGAFSHVDEVSRRLASGLPTSKMHADAIINANPSHLYY